MQNITVLIPTYNHGNVLIYQIESLLKQTIPPKRIIILDDGSTDKTKEILRSYESNENIKVIFQNENTGLHAAIDILLDQVDTEFFAFAAADDMLTSNWCMTTSSLLETYKEAKMVVSNSFIFDNNTIYSTDAINVLNNKCEGVCKPGQFIKLLMRHGKFPPSNTILYRSDIIEELIRPIFLKEELRSLTDILLILAIAVRYPIAYSVKPTGVFIKNQEGYGNSFYSKKYLNNLIANVKLFFLRDRFVECDELMRFTIHYVKYSWSKQIIIKDLRANEIEKRGFGYFCKLLLYYTRLLILILVYKRFKFFKIHKFNNDSHYCKLENVLAKNLFKRFNSGNVR